MVQGRKRSGRRVIEGLGVREFPGDADAGVALRQAHG